MKELKKAVKSLADDAAGAQAAPAADDGGGAGAGALQGKAAARAKKADDYHARHPDWVAQFNALTHGECAGGPGGVKWSAVRAWQQEHWEANNLFSDGLIGPKTLEAARIVSKGAKGGGTDGAADKQAKGGDAEAAEASAGKPELDGPDESASDAKRAPAGHGSAGDEAAGGEPQKAGDDLRLPPEGNAASKKDGGGATSVGQFEEALAAVDKLLEDFKPESQPAAPAQKSQAGAESGKPAAEVTGAMMTHLGEYLEAAKRLATIWPKSSAKGRCHALLEAINKALAHERVFPIQDAVPVEQSGIAGQFHPGTWSMTLDEGLFSNSALPEKQIHDAASTVFHEGRHAEQRFLMARMLATNGTDPVTIAAELKMDKEAVARACKDAKNHPVTPESKEGLSAKKLHDDAVGNEKKHRSLEILASQVTTAGNHAATLFEALPELEKQRVADKWNGYRARMHQAIEAYKALPTERDAYAAEAQLNRK